MSCGWCWCSRTRPCLGWQGARIPHPWPPPPTVAPARHRRAQGNNELWLALVLTHQAVFGLTGPELAGLLGAILSGEVLKRPGVQWVAYPASQKVCGWCCSGWACSGWRAVHHACTHNMHAHAHTHIHTHTHTYTPCRWWRLWMPLSRSAA